MKGRGGVGVWKGYLFVVVSTFHSLFSLSIVLYHNDMYIQMIYVFGAWSLTNLARSPFL